jgi:hypothetical protein
LTAMSTEAGVDRGGQLTVGQVELLLQELGAQAARINEILDLMTRLAGAGGRDWEDYERVLDGLAREGVKLMMYARSALHPELQQRALTELAEAARPSSPLDGTREAVHHKMAMALLVAVWFVGEHHLVDVADWPPELASAVLGAVRRAARINDDPMWDNLGRGRRPS